MDTETEVVETIELETVEREITIVGDYHSALFGSVKEFYDRDLFCDLVISAKGEAAQSVRCHAIVLATVVPSIKNLLGVSEWDPCEKAYCLCLPDLDYSVLKEFVDDLYRNLGRPGAKELVVNLGEDLANVLGLSTGLDYHQLQCVADETSLHRGEEETTVVDESNYQVVNGGDNTLAFNLFNETTGVDESLARYVVGKATKSAAAAPEAAAKCGTKRKAEDQKVTLVDDGPATFNTSCNSANRASFHRLESVAFGFLRNTGLFRAVTQPYYTTPNVIDDQTNVMVTKEGRVRQFRMKLPEDQLVALIAVGMRDGSNVASTLAMKSTLECKNGSWADEKSMVNIISMIKNICGTSFGVILRHPRCSESNRARISRELVNKYKDTFRSLSKQEKTNIATDSRMYLKEFDTVAPRIRLRHLPQKPKKLEFNLVGKLKTSEIMDYAIVSGSHAKHLTIRSFFNFRQQNVSDVRIMTILLDTLACFFNYGSRKSIMDFNILLDTFYSYAGRTCQNLAIQELGIVRLDDAFAATAAPPVQPTAAASGPSVMSDDTQFSIRNGQTEGLETLLNLPPKKSRKNDLDVMTTGKLSCPVAGCPETFFGTRKMNTHIDRMHPSHGGGFDEDRRPCILCGKVVRSDIEMKKHMYSYHKETQCKHCGEKFLGMHFLQSHNSRVHMQFFKCDVCGQECRGRTKLKNHKINKHMEEHQKPFVCSLCGRGYAEKMKLKSHQMNVHIRSRPFKCRLEGCSADFNELANRNAHERTVHKYDYRKQVMDIQKSVSTSGHQYF